MQREKMSASLRNMLVVLLLLVCGYSMCNNTIAITMNPIIDTFALTGSSQGLMNSMMNLGSILPLFIIPLMQGRVNKLWLILASALILLLSMIFTGAAQGFALLLAACVLLGAAHNFLDTTCNAYIVDLWPGNNSKCLGLLHGFYGLGGLLTPFLISFVLARSTWRTAYSVGAAIFALIVVIFAVVALPGFRRIGGSTANVEQKLTGAMLKRYIRNRRNVCLLIAAALYGASQVGLVNWVARYMLVRFNDADMGSMCVSAYWVCCAVCRLVTPGFRIRPAKMLIAGGLLGGVFHAIGVLSGSAVFMVIASGLVGLVSGVCLPVILSEAAVGNEAMTSLTTSGIFLSMGISRILLPLLMGAVADTSIVAAMLLPAGAILISSALCIDADRRRPIQKDGARLS